MFQTMNAELVGILLKFADEVKENPDRPQTELVKAADHHVGDILCTVANHPNQHVIDVYRHDVCKSSGRRR